MTDRGRPRKGGAPAPLKPRRRYGRWRAATLTSVYLLMGVHIAHWKIAGKTLAPLELNEVMNTLEQGVITAGFIFMSIAVVTVLFFGRFLCSWGCHILALEDLCSWLLKKIGIRPKPFRSRILLLVPPATMFYMFLWPQVSRLLQGRELSEFRVQGDEEGWASFVTDNFWRNLPGPWIIFLTFMICGFLIVYILGSRSFCRYVCPYGVIFAFTDRFAPGNIVSTGECQECGKCTATCQSQVRVHEELKLYGKVVNPACMKDLDCVNICPNHAIGYRFTWPAFFKSWRRKGLSRTRYDFSLGEETLMAVTFLTSLAVFRGLYGYVPFLMSLGLAAVLAFAAVLLVRLTGAGSLKLNNLELKSSGRLTRPGWAFVSLLLIFSLFAAHSGFIRAHEALGNRAYDRVTEARGAGVGLPPAEIAAAIRHYGACDRWGLIDPPYID
ncbi:MAG: 4Fe-4S binding protein, partial [Planctomycetota bacterium]